MRSETEPFFRFLDLLKINQMVTYDEADEALRFLDGIDGVLSEGTYILAYQGIARHMAKKLSFDEQKTFVEEHGEVLAEDPDARYFFVESLLDDPKLKRKERLELMGLMPSKYQTFLLKRFP